MNSIIIYIFFLYKKDIWIWKLQDNFDDLLLTLPYKLPYLKVGYLFCKPAKIQLNIMWTLGFFSRPYMWNLNVNSYLEFE